MECKVPLRNYLGSAVSVNFVERCATLNFYYVLGCSAVLIGGILILHSVGQSKYNNEPEQNKKYIIVVPKWLVILPALYVAWWYFMKLPEAKLHWELEKLKFKTSGKNRKDYINYGEAEDRQKEASLKGLIGTAVLAASNFFAQFLRGY